MMDQDTFFHMLCLVKAATNYQIPLLSKASSILGHASYTKVKGMVLKFFLGAQPPSPSFPVYVKIFDGGICFLSFTKIHKDRSTELGF